MQRQQLAVSVMGLALTAALLSCHESPNGQSQARDAEARESVPEEIRRVVFEHSRFAQPIVLRLPVDDRESRAELERRLPEAGRRLALTPIISTEGFRSINKHLLSYLIDYDLAQVETKLVQWTYTENEYHFLLYTPAFATILDTGNVSGSYPFRQVVNLQVGERVMESIDYTNTYEQVVMGVSLDIWAIRFTYSLVTTTSLPDFPEVIQSFEGRARAYLDPDDGEWKLDRLELEDRALGEYLRVIGERYPRFEPTPPPEATQSGSVSGSVVSAAGDPIPNTSVQLRTSPLAGLTATQRGDLVDQSLNTDASGRFQFEDIPPGRYVLSAYPDGRLVRAQVRVTGGTEVERDIRRDGPSAVSSPDRDLQDRVRTAERVEGGEMKGAGSGDVSSDDIAARMEALSRNFPAYYARIITEIDRCFRPPTRRNLTAVVRFDIERDGTVNAGSIGLDRRSGNVEFDRATVQAVECAGRGRFGPLPENLPWDVLPILFTFRPAGSGDQLTFRQAPGGRRESGRTGLRLPGPLR